MGEMSPGTEGGMDTPEGTAMVRVAHMSPNAPNVDVYVDGSAALEDVPFGAVSAYLELPSGPHQVEITAAGDPDASVFDGELELAADTAYTVAAIGELGDMADEAFEPLVIEDDVSSPGSDTARLQAVHASPDAPAVDITAGGGETVLFDGVPYGASGAVEVPAGDYTVEIRGDTEGNDGDVVAEYDVSLAGDTVYTAFAAGYLSPGDEPAATPFNLLVTTPEGRGAAPEPSSVPAEMDEFLADANGYDGSLLDATGQDSVTVAVGGDGFAFGPAALRIDAGTTVNWEWMGGTHNVASTQESASDFTSGEPTSDTDTTFSQSFDNTGLQFYVCDVHEGSGMLGAIDVV
jgi:halocyanin-like protein